MEVQRNGELLALAVEHRFDVFVTPDQGIPDQQDLASFDVAVVILAAGRKRMATYEQLADEFRESVDQAKRGEAPWLRS